MDKFIDILTTGNISPLSPKEWDSIIVDYLTFSENKTAKTVLIFEREIAYINNEVYFTKLLCNLLINTQHPDVVNSLRKKGYRYQFTSDTIVKDVENVLISLKSKESRVKQLQAELNNINTSSNNITPKKSDFYKQFDVLAEFSKVPVINPSEITIAQYCAKVVRYSDHVDHQNKLYGNRQNK